MWQQSNKNFDASEHNRFYGVTSAPVIRVARKKARLGLPQSGPSSLCVIPKKLKIESRRRREASSARDAVTNRAAVQRVRTANLLTDRCLRNYNRRIIANVKFMPGTPIWNDLVRFGQASIGVPADFMRRGFTANSLFSVADFRFRSPRLYSKDCGRSIASRGQDITVAPAIGLSERVSKQPLDMSHSPCQFCHR